MKVNILNQQPSGFEPIELHITIESLEELADFWGRMNIYVDVLKELQDKHDIIYPLDKGVVLKDNTHEICRLLEDAMNQRGLAVRINE